MLALTVWDAVSERQMAVRYQFHAGVVSNEFGPFLECGNGDQIDAADLRCEFLEHLVPSVHGLIARAHEVIHEHDRIVFAETLAHDIASPYEEVCVGALVHSSGETKSVEHGIAALTGATGKRDECESAAALRFVGIPSFEPFQNLAKCHVDVLCGNKLNCVKHPRCSVSIACIKLIEPIR
jgi:hypothetical protein